MSKKRYANEAKLGAFIILVAVVLAYLSLKIGRFNVGEDLKVDAVFDDASGLVPDGAVMLAGVRIGTIHSLSVEHDRARVEMLLRSDASVRKDARATIRMKSLLGEKFLEIIPQSKDAPPLESGDTIQSTFVPTEFDQLINRVASIVDRIDTDEPGKENMIENMSKLTASLSKIAAESGESIPAALRNLRDVTEDLREIISENKKGMKDTLGEVRLLAASGNRILDRNEEHINNIASSLDKSTVAFAQNSEEMAKNLNEVLKNLALVADRMPKILDDMGRLSGKFETTLDKANNLLAKLETLDETTIRKLLQEEGITINLFSKKIEGEAEAEKKEKAKERGWLIFPK